MENTTLQLIQLSQPPSLTLALKKHQDIALTHGTLHIADDATVCVIQKFDADL